MGHDVLLQMTDICKEFPGVKALDHVSLTVKRGTVHALMGENGAGKSTLMKCLFGMYAKDGGQIFLEGKEINFKNSKEALENGVAMVHQELNQALKRNVMDNLWDRHPPFQIDGNFGYTAGVGEMLVGGSDGVVRILPALPPEWQRGEFSGIVSRGGISFDCKWEDSRITYLAATAKEDISVELRFSAPYGQYSDACMPLKLKAGEEKVIYRYTEDTADKTGGIFRSSGKNRWG